MVYWSIEHRGAQTAIYSDAVEHLLLRVAAAIVESVDHQQFLRDGDMLDVS